VLDDTPLEKSDALDHCVVIALQFAVVVKPILKVSPDTKVTLSRVGVAQTGDGVIVRVGVCVGVRVLVGVTVRVGVWVGVIVLVGVTVLVGV
jgi:hypothetical protein